MNKKKVLVLALAVCLLAILSFSTLAWFTDFDEVTNQFHVATSTEEPDDIFSIDVQEQVDTDGDGVADAIIDEGKVDDGFHYENIYPSAELVKAPKAVNTGKYDQYVRMHVTVDEAWDALVNGDLNATLKGLDTAKWTFAGKTVEGGKVTYTYYLNRVLPHSDVENTGCETLFTHVVIPETLTQEDMAALTDGMFTMDIVAEAVQADNTGDNAQDAFALVMP